MFTKFLKVIIHEQCKSSMTFHCLKEREMSTVLQTDYKLIFYYNLTIKTKSSS